MAMVWPRYGEGKAILHASDSACSRNGRAFYSGIELLWFREEQFEWRCIFQYILLFF